MHMFLTLPIGQIAAKVIEIIFIASVVLYIVATVIGALVEMFID